ncbi:MAG: hypothetical protein VXZ59_02220 [Cyanobacteriota bacterium]|nr:hypothetical protein [Cyanobacteriota bacterium]
MSLFHSLSGVSVVESSPDCCHQPALMGAHIIGTKLIALCPANVRRADQDLEQVLLQ